MWVKQDFRIYKIWFYPTSVYKNKINLSHFWICEIIFTSFMPLSYSNENNIWLWQLVVKYRTFFFRLVTQGFHTSGSHVRLSVDSDNSYCSQLVPRITVSSQLLLELLNAIYFAMFDRNTSYATQALDDIYNRACYECYTDVLLVANSIKNLLHISRSGKFLLQFLHFLNI